MTSEVTNTRRRSLIVLAVCVVVAICTEMLPVGLLPEISQGLHVSPAATGLLVSLYAVVVAVTSVPIAEFVERWPRRVVLAVLLGAYSLSNLCFAAAPDYAVAIVARSIGGLEHAGFFAVCVAAAVSLVDAEGSGRADVGLVLFGYGLGGLVGLAAATAVIARWPEQALAADGLLIGLSLVFAAVVGRPAAIVAVVGVWGVAFGAFPTLTQTVTLRAAHGATDAASALVNATTNIGIAGGALLGSVLLGPLAVPGLGWVGAALAASSLAVYTTRLRPAVRQRTADPNRTGAPTGHGVSKSDR